MKQHSLTMKKREWTPDHWIKLAGVFVAALLVSAVGLAMVICAIKAPEQTAETLKAYSPVLTLRAEHGRN